MRLLPCFAGFLLAIGSATAITVPGNPAAYVAADGTGFDGVVRLNIGIVGGSQIGCSGALIGAYWVLTAAHCVTNTSGVVDALSTTITFHVPGPNLERYADQYHIAPGWNGAVLNPYDLALLRMTQAAPVQAERYSLYRQNNEFGSVITVAGFGLSGNGVVQSTSYPFGTRRVGQNEYDGFIGADLASARILAFDFDNGLAAQNLIGSTGLGANEVFAVFGDSGGPSFIGGQIAGVHSFLSRSSRDIDGGPNPNGSYGEYAGDIRVSAFTSWIDTLVPVPEPGTWALAACGLLLLAGRGVRLRVRRRLRE